MVLPNHRSLGATPIGGTAVFGPLFFKELLEVSRRKRYFLLRVAAGLVMLLIIAGPTSQPIRVGSSAANTAELARRGRQIFENWSSGIIVGLVIGIPALNCGLIAGEKQRRTFDILITAMLSDREIMLGKIASRLFVSLLMIASMVPILAAVSMYGGVDWTDMVQASLIIVTTMLFTTSVALYYSTVTDKAYIALFRTYMTLGFVWWLLPYGLPMVLNFYGLQRWFALYTPFEINRLVEGINLNPPTVIIPLTKLPVSGVAVTFPPGPFPRGTATGLTPTGWLLRFTYTALFVVIYSLLANWLFRRSYRNLRRYLVPRGGSRLVRACLSVFHRLVGKARSMVENRRHLPALSSLWKWEEKSRTWGPLEEWFGDSVNPLSFRNRRANVFDPQHYVMGMQILAWIVVLGTIFYSTMFNMDFLISHSSHEFVMQCIAGVALCATGILSACSLSREKQHGSWECLLTTELTPSEYLFSTLTGVTRHLIPTLILLCITIFVFGFNVLFLVRFKMWGMIVFSLLVYLLTTGTLVSLCCKRILESLAALVMVLVMSTGLASLGPALALPLVTLLAVIVAVMFYRGNHAGGTLIVFMMFASIFTTAMGFLHDPIRFLDGNFFVSASSDVSPWWYLLVSRSRQVSIVTFLMPLWAASAFACLLFVLQFERLSGRVRAIRLHE